MDSRVLSLRRCKFLQLLHGYRQNGVSYRELVLGLAELQSMFLTYAVPTRKHSAKEGCMFELIKLAVAEKPKKRED
jgi:hypothetical protein